MTHELKTWQMYFQEVKRGYKTFEIRVNDRDFKEGDILVLKEYDPIALEYTGDEITKMAGYIIYNEVFVRTGQCVISLVEPDVYPERKAY